MCASASASEATASWASGPGLATTRCEGQCRQALVTLVTLVTRSKRQCCMSMYLDLGLGLVQTSLFALSEVMHEARVQEEQRRQAKDCKIPQVSSGFAEESPVPGGRSCRGS